MSKSKLPRHLEAYFWDIEFSSLCKKKYAFQIIKRVLDRGKTSDIKWLLANYETKEISRVIRQTKDLSRPTATFWSGFLNIAEDKILCLQKPYSPTRFGLSS